MDDATIFVLTEILVNDLTKKVDEACSFEKHEAHLLLPLVEELTPNRVIHAAMRHFEKLGYRVEYNKRMNKIGLYWSRGKVRRTREKMGYYN